MPKIDIRANVTLIALQDGSFFMFDSFGITGFLCFFVDNDADVISNFINNFENIPKGNLMFYSFTLDVNKYLPLDNTTEETLSDTCRSVCNVLTTFAIAANKENIEINGLYSQLQLLTVSTCGIFQLFFFNKLYNSKKIQNFYRR